MQKKIYLHFILIDGSSMQKFAFLLSLSIFLRAICLTKFLPEVAMIYFIALFVGVIIVSSKKIYLNTEQQQIGNIKTHE